MQTALCEIESVVNSRVLTYQVEGENIMPVIPSHFWLGKNVRTLPDEADFRLADLNKVKLNDIFKHGKNWRMKIWSWFRKEYLPALLEHYHEKANKGR